MCIPCILSLGSFVCPTIDRSLFSHGIYGNKISIIKIQNIPKLVQVAEKMKQGFQVRNKLLQYKPGNVQHKGMLLRMSQQIQQPKLQS